MVEKYDKVIKNIPVKDVELNKLWIYEGSDSFEFTPFAGKYFNKAPKAIALNMDYLRIVTQINKSILGIFEGNYEIYNPTKLYSIGDVVLKDKTFYVSLINDNNGYLEDISYWYKYEFNPSNFLFVQDESTGELYKITINNGVITPIKV